MISENGIENIIFDLDGTLVDSAEDIFKCLEKSYAQLNIPLTVKLDTQFIGPPLSQMIQNITPDITEEQIQLVVQAFRAHYDSCPLTHTRLRAGMPEALALLKKKGLKMFVVTNKPKQATLRILKHLRLDNFKDVITPDSVPNRHLSKADMLAYVLQRHQLNSSSTFMVGDSAYDVYAARQHGIECMAICNGYGDLQEIQRSSPHCMIHTTEEFPKTILKIINKR